MGKKIQLTTAQRIEYLTTVMVLEILVLWLLAIINYGEPFKFWNFAISSLGAIHTKSGYTNYISLLLFDASMLAAAVCMYRMASIYKHARIINGKIYKNLYYLGFAGAIIICFPHDIHNGIHSVGAGLLVFGNVAVTFVRIVSQRHIIGKKTYQIRLLLFLIPILIYAYSWAVWITDIVQAFQKIAFTMLFIIEKCASNSKHISLEQKFVFRKVVQTQYTHDES